MQQAPEYNPYAAPRGEVQQPVATADDIKIFSAQGRLGRLRLIAYTFVMSLVLFGGVGLLTLIFGGVGYLVSGSEDAFLVAGVIFFIIAFIPALIITIRWGIRRVHDFNVSGWLMLLMFVPYVNSIFQLILILVPGTKGPNPYGPVPPPNSSAVKVLAGIYIGMTVLGLVVGIAAAITIPFIAK